MPLSHCRYADPAPIDRQIRSGSTRPASSRSIADRQPAAGDGGDGAQHESLDQRHGQLRDPVPDGETSELRRCENSPDTQYAFSHEYTLNGATINEYVHRLIGLGSYAREAGPDLTGSGAAPLQDDDPRRIGPIPLIGRLGTGGMGRVYLGVHEGSYAAVKQVLPSIVGGDQDFLRRFGHELDNLARLPARDRAAASR